MCDRDDKGPWGEFARAAEEFGASMDQIFRGFGCRGDEGSADFGPFRFHANAESPRPRMNRFTDKEGKLILEFLLPGFEMKDINLSFQADSLRLSAKRPAEDDGREGGADQASSHKASAGPSPRGFRIRDIEGLEYPVPAAAWDQEKTTAVLRLGILRVIVPPREASSAGTGVKVEIVSD